METRWEGGAQEARVGVEKRDLKDGSRGRKGNKKTPSKKGYVQLCKRQEKRGVGQVWS